MYYSVKNNLHVATELYWSPHAAFDPFRKVCDVKVKEQHTHLPGNHSKGKKRVVVNMAATTATGKRMFG
jgi:hypothetical protein